MELNKFDSLMNLDVSTYDWNCRVRAQAVWKAMNRETQELWGLNILFIDDSVRCLSPNILNILKNTFAVYIALIYIPFIFLLITEQPNSCLCKRQIL